MEQATHLAVKIRRVLDVLRFYVANWPWLRGDKDDVPLEQSWRGKPKKYRVQVLSLKFLFFLIYTINITLHPLFFNPFYHF